MKRSLLVMLSLLLLLPAFAFAGGAEEEVVDVEMAGAGTQFEGVLDVDHSSGWEAGVKGGRLVIDHLTDPKSFNDWVAAETSSTEITDMLMGSVVRRNQFTLEWEAAMAESWTVSADEKTVTYRLRAGLTWSDGTAITAKDFVFGANQVTLREDVGSNGRSSQFQSNPTGGPDIPIVYKYINSRTFSATFPEVSAGLLTQSGVSPAPMHIFGPLMGWNEAQHGLDYEYEFGTDEEGNEILVEIKPDGVDYSALTSFWGVDTNVRNVVSSGPWVMEEYVPSQRVVFKPNPYWYEKDDNGVQLPYLDEMVYLVVGDQDTMLQKFLAGETDEYGLRGEDYAVLVDRQVDMDMRIYAYGADFGTTFITFNQNPIEGDDDAGIAEPELTWLSNKSFRQAMAYLVDRQTIINNIQFGFGYPQYSFIPRVSPYYWAGSDNAAFQFDPNKAADLLDSIDYIDRDGDGWREDPDGNKISLQLSTNSGNTTREGIGEIFAQEAARVGIELNFSPQDFNALVTQLVATYDWNMILIGLTGSVDPISGQNVYPSSGNLHMIEPNQAAPRRAWEARVDEAWVMANQTTDEAQRKAGFEIIQREWIDNVPWVYTSNAANMGAIGAEFGNYYPQPIDGYEIKYISDRIYVK
ncbi:MAG: ABC transporter substrate-binding protein [Spirochaetales bacterium]|nr:ABC transporter substrate-binding protein [Spirochaetales bacterium]